MKTQRAAISGSSKSIIKLCLLLIASVLIVKYVISSGHEFHFMLGRLNSLLRVNQANKGAVEETSKEIFSEPTFTVQDSNPVDILRLLGFVLICFMFVMPFLS